MRYIMINTKKLFKYMNKVAIVILLLSTIITANASPITMEVVALNNNVQPGQTALYRVDLTNPTGTGADEVLNNIYVTKPLEMNDVDFSFTQTSGTITEGSTLSITLSAQVPGNKPVGNYQFDVFSNVGVDFGGEVIEPTDDNGNVVPYQYLGVVLNVLVPEFPTVAVPVISALGLLFIMKRRKDRN
jgi:hypothetical protein